MGLKESCSPGPAGEESLQETQNEFPLSGGAWSKKDQSSKQCDELRSQSQSSQTGWSPITPTAVVLCEW